MRALPLSLALAVLSAATLSAQQPTGAGNFLQPTAAPAPTQIPGVVDVTPSHIPPATHNGHEHNGHGARHGQCWLDTHTENEWGGITTFAEVLILRPRWQGVDYAIIDPNLNQVPEGVTAGINGQGRAGFRVGGGWKMPNSGWVIGLTYTYYRSEDEEGITAPAGGNLYPTLTRPGIIDVVNAARAESTTRLNVFDFDIGSDLHANETIGLRFFGGLRLASVDYSMNAFYDGGNASRAQAALSSDFDGAGPTIGGQGTWKWGNFSMFGRARMSLLYGEIHGRYRESDRGGQSLLADVTNSVSRVVPTLDLGIGAGWQFRNMHVAIGYEINHWFQVAETPQFLDDVSVGKFMSRQSSLSLDGVFFRVGFDY